ncbi:MAG: calcium/sodium antiporter [Gammaproteobacteria bacterium]|nr:calcium/sodium antiporter [Gammaproteobacteria bacterium]NIR96543.1 calcium/sodium antiporter [Gammaproteobacteria bacterium]NIT62281.1 calcium/sodium antiporter [Gammaproteobacteria bacterium]NIV19185.1 calcium/sodium antiporter [Gammaproteobacteria bacterium]NIX10053.1 calcium/sodium antiporter [Gammaproteobacteria bacterium]
MLAYFSAVVAGIALLVWGADRFVVGAAATAGNLGISPLIIGLTIVGFGTSAPEIVVSIVAAWSGNTALAIGNALGSNIANIALILGATALIAPLIVRSDTLRREFPVLLATMLVALILIVDGTLGRSDGVVLLLGMVVMLYWVASLGLRGRADPIVAEFTAEMPPEMPTWRALLWLGLGLALLLASSRALVWGAVHIALALGVSELVIGLTIVALGTSLPELATSIMSALKGEHDIAIGNVIGSNMFNLLVVLGLPGLIRPGPVPSAVLERDFPVMIGVTLALFALAYGFRQPGHISRPAGAVLLLAFTAYQTLLYYAEKH